MLLSSSAARRQHRITTSNDQGGVQIIGCTEANHKHLLLSSALPLTEERKRRAGPHHPGTLPKDEASRPLSRAREREGEGPLKRKGEPCGGPSAPFYLPYQQTKPRTPDAARAGEEPRPAD